MSEIKVTRCLGAALSDSDRLGWQVSYIERQFDTKAEAQIESERLRSRPTMAEAKAISEGRFIDEELSECALTSTESTL